MMQKNKKKQAKLVKIIKKWLSSQSQSFFIFYIIIFIMKSDPATKYVKRIFQIYIYSITFNNTFKLHFHSNQSASLHSSNSESTSKIMKCFEISSVDIIHNSQRTVDSQIHLELYSNQIAVSTVTFDLKKEKFVKDDKSLFRKTFNHKSGFVDYKFVSARAEIISHENYSIQLEKRNKVLLRKEENYEQLKKENAQYEHIQKQKDRMIQNLQDKMTSLINQNAELNRKISQDMQKYKKPLNINLNIQQKKDRAVYFDDKNFEKIAKQNEEYRQEINILREKLSTASIQIKKLNLNCKILIQEIRGDPKSQFANAKIMQIEKKLSVVDNGYLLAKTISNYDKSLRKTLQIQDNIKQINDLLNESKPRSDKEEQKSSGKSLRKYISLSDSSKFKPMDKDKEKDKDKNIEIEIEKDKNFLALKRSQVLVDLKKSLRQSIKKDDGMVNQLLRKEKQIQVLQNELQKKQVQIEKLLYKQNDFEKQYQQYQEEKSKLFANMTLNALSSGKGSSEQLSSLKELTIYNTELVKEKHKLLEELQKLKQQNNQKAKKIQNYEITTRKSIIFLTQITKEKELLQEKVKILVEEEQAQQEQRIVQRQQQYDSLKQQFIECSQQLGLVKIQTQSLAENDAQLKKQKSVLQAQLQALRLENKKLQVIADQSNNYQAQIKMLEGRYQGVQKLQKGIKIFVTRLQSQMNLTLKKKDEQIYQAEMKSLLKQTYAKINDFQEDYYQILIDAAKLGQEDTQKYYESMRKFLQEAATTVKTQEEMWNNKILLLKDRQVKLKAIKEKQQFYRQKQQKRLLLIEDEFQHFMDGFKKINMRINELEAYKFSLKEILKEKNLDPFTNTIEKQNSSVSSMNSQELFLADLPKISEQKPQQRSIKKSKMYRSLSRSIVGIPPKLRIQQQDSESGEDNNAKKTQLLKQSINIQMMRADDIDQRKKMRESINLMHNSRLEKIQENHNRLRESQIQRLAIREELTRENLQFKKKQSRLMQAHNQKKRELEKQILQEKIEKEAMVIRLKQIQSQLERQKKRVETVAEVVSKDTQKEVLQLNTRVKQLQEQVVSLNSLLEKAGEELVFLSSSQKRKSQELAQLEQQKANLLAQMKTYEETEAFLIQQVSSIKEVRKQNELQINRLLEQRSQKFIQIQKIKANQAEKLKEMIEELNEKLQNQVNQNMKSKYRVEDLHEELTETIKEKNRIKQQMQMYMQSLERQLSRQKDIKEALQNQNNQYYRNIIELSDSVTAHQKEILRLNVLIESHNKEKVMLQEISTRLADKETAMKQQSKKMQQILKQKKEEIRKWQADFEKLQYEIRYLSQQLDDKKEDNTTLKQQNQKLKEQIFLKQRQVLQVEKDKGLALINCEKIQMELDVVNTHMANLDKTIKDLASINDRLTAEIKNNDKNVLKGTQRLNQSKRDLLVSRAITKKNETQSLLQRSRQIKLRKIPELSMSIMSNQRGMVESIRGGESNKSLHVPIMKTNKMLNLPSLDSEANPDQENNLQIIEQRHDQLNDTFLGKEQDAIEIIVNNQSKQIIGRQSTSFQRFRPAEDSEINIQIPEEEMMDDEELLGYRNMQVPNSFANNEEQANANAELINEIIRLKKIISEMQPRRQIQLSSNSKGQQNKNEISYFSSKSNDEFAQLIRPQKTYKSRKLSKDMESLYNSPNEDRTKELQAELQTMRENINAMKKKEIQEELYAAEIQQKLSEAQKSLQEEEKNVQELIAELKKVSDHNISLQNQIDEAKEKMGSLTQIQKQQRVSFEQQRQGLISQSLKKDSIIYGLQAQVGNCRQKVEKSQALATQFQEYAKKANSRAKDFQKQLKKQQQSYIKYEEQSQLEILKLRQQLDSLLQKITQKSEQIILLGQKYIELESTNRSLLIDLKQQQIYCQDTQKAKQGLMGKFQKVKGEIESNEVFRKNTFKKMKELQLQNYRLTEQVSTFTRNAGIDAQKWNIRLSAEKESVLGYQEKLKEKDNVIILLKNQIANYNDECDELKKLNEKLSSQMMRAEKQLKEIMMQYEDELQTVSKTANSRISTTNQLRNALKNTEKELEERNRDIRRFKEEIKALSEEKQDLRCKYQVIRLQNNRLNADYGNQMQFKKDQCEQLRSKLELAQKQCQDIKEKNNQAYSRLRQQTKQFQNKISSISLQNSQLKQVIKKLTKRPSQDQLNKSQLMVSILQTKVKEYQLQLERIQRSRSSLSSQPQSDKQAKKIAESYQIEIQNLQQSLIQQKKKNGSLCGELRELVKAFKKLQADYLSSKEKNESLKRVNSNMSMQCRKMQRKINELQSQMRELQLQNKEINQELSSLRFSRLDSFSKSNADTTIK